MKKFTIYIIIAICLIGGIMTGFLFNSYQQNKVIKETANEYIELYLNHSDDVSQYEHIDKDEANQIVTNAKKLHLSNIRSYFKNSGLSVNDEQIQNIYIACLKTLSSFSCQIKIEKKSNMTVKVAVKCPQINIDELEQTATERTLDKIDKNNIKKLNDSSELFVKEIIRELENYEPSKNTKTVIFTLKKQKQEWKLKDLEQFIKDMNAATIQGW